VQKYMKNDPILADIKQDADSLPYSPWEEMGFRFGDKGTHTSRTIMLEELSLLLHECAEDWKISRFFINRSPHYVK